MTFRWLGRLSLSLLVLSGSFLWAQDPAKKLADATIQKWLVGNWRFHEERQGIKIEATAEYKSDGTMAATIKATQMGQTRTYQLEATWRIKNGHLLEVVKNMEPPLVKPGTASKDKVLSIDQKGLKIRTEDGQLQHLKRLSQEG